MRRAVGWTKDVVDSSAQGTAESKYEMEIFWWGWAAVGQDLRGASAEV